MKKILMTLALVFVTQMAFCQSFDDVITKLKKLPNAEAMTLEKDMLKMVAATAPDDAKKTFDKIDKLIMLGIENPSAESQATCLKEVKSLKNKYSKLAEEEEEGQTVLLFGDMDDDGNPKALIMATIGKDECMIVYIDGNVSPDELSALDSMK